MKIFKDIEQGTEKWLELRAGVITGTKLKSIVGNATVQKTAIYELIGEEFTPVEPVKQNDAMKRGNELEPIAKAKYQELTGEKVEEVGFIKIEDYVGLSPDGIINKDGKYKKAVEIKCPMGKNYSKYYLEGKLPAEYKWQVVHYFIVIPDLEELDFVIFNPDFYIKEAQMKIINIKREDLIKDIEKAKIAIAEFRESWLENINKLISEAK